MKKCYLSKPPAQDVSLLADILKRNDVVFVSGRSGLIGEPLFDDAVSLKDADIFIGILDGSRSDYRVLYEAGVAIGLEKPTALIAPPAKDNVFDFPGCMMIRAMPHERTALEIHLAAFLLSPPESPFALVSTRSSSLSHKRERSLNRNRDSLIRFDSELERKVYENIVRNGGNVFVKDDRSKRSSYRPDFFVSLPDPETGVANNIVIEVKGYVARQHVEEIEAKLKAFMSKAAVSTGLILVDKDVPRQRLSRSPQIFWLTIADFNEFLARGELAKFIATERSRLLHGDF